MNDTKSNKVAAIAALFAVVIFGLVGAIIAVGTNKASENEVASNEEPTQIVEPVDTEEKVKKKEEKTEETKVADDSSTQIVAVTPAANEVYSTSAAALPTSGPNDVLPVALSLGALTTVATAAFLKVKEERF